nr:hypothetical protein P5644_07875 [Bacillus velezensis]
MSFRRKQDSEWALAIGDFKWESYKQFAVLKRVFPDLEKNVRPVLKGIPTLHSSFKRKWTPEKIRLYSLVINTEIIKSILASGFKPSLITGAGDGYYVALAAERVSSKLKRPFLSSQALKNLRTYPVSRRPFHLSIRTLQKRTRRFD